MHNNVCQEFDSPDVLNLVRLLTTDEVDIHVVMAKASYVIESSTESICELLRAKMLDFQHLSIEIYAEEQGIQLSNVISSLKSCHRTLIASRRLRREPLILAIGWSEDGPTDLFVVLISDGPEARACWMGFSALQSPEEDARRAA